MTAEYVLRISADDVKLGGEAVRSGGMLLPRGTFTGWRDGLPGTS